jgi:hypothetical protein
VAVENLFVLRFSIDEIKSNYSFVGREREKETNRLCQIIHINARSDRLADSLEKRERIMRRRKLAHLAVTVKKENRSNVETPQCE